jgi:hypothetical protein
MRTSLLHGAALGFVVALSSCGTTPAVTVVHVPPGDHAETPRGDPVKFKRGAQEPYAALHGGFFVVRTKEEWRTLWAEAGKEQEMPPTLDTSRSMLVLAVGDTRDVIAMQVKSVVDTGEVLFVSVHETKPGDGCTSKADRPAYEAVLVDRIDKPVKFVVVDDRSEACGPPPSAEAECRVGSAAKWDKQLEAQPGDVVECTMSASAHGRFEISDRVLHLDALPGGSSAKLAYTKGPTRGTFTVDVFGEYKVRAEAADETGRRGVAYVPVVAAPPKTNDVLVELVWSQFDATDDPDTFPRVRLRAREPGPEGHECTFETPIAGACEAKVQGTYTHMKIAPTANKLALAVTYADERVDKGPLVCLQLYKNGERTGETCDRKHREPDERWEAGVLDPATGKLGDSSAPRPPAAADAGAADGGKK